MRPEHDDGAQLTAAKERQRQSEIDLHKVSLWLLYAFLFGWLAVILRNATASHWAPSNQSSIPLAISDVLQAFGWTLACVATGFASGFLFGIPKSVARPEVAATGGEDAPLQSRLRVNTNLEDISDWLTKVLVGATLTQVGKIPAAVHAAAVFMAGGTEAVGVSEYAAILIYFSVLGFMSGYLLTRLFFSRAFAIADQDTDTTSHVTLERVHVTERGHPGIGAGASSI